MSYLLYNKIFNETPLLAELLLNYELNIINFKPLNTIKFKQAPSA